MLEPSPRIEQDEETVLQAGEEIGVERPARQYEAGCPHHGLGALPAGLWLHPGEDERAVDAPKLGLACLGRLAIMKGADEDPGAESIDHEV